MSPFLYAYGGAALLALLLTPAVSWLARRIGAVDVPGPRAVHPAPIPRMGGVALFLSTVIPLVVLLFVRQIAGEVSDETLWQAALLLCASAGIFLVGLIDDLRHLPARFKLITELLLAGGLCWAGVRISSLVAAGDVLPLGAGGCLLTVLWIAGVTNAVNLSDGLDGLAAGIGAIVCGAVALFALHHGQTIPVLFLLTLLGSLSGFLLFNFHPARVFMGDSGSLFLGFTLGACSIMCATPSAPLAALTLPALALGIPILDTLFSALRRFLEGRSIFAPDRSHFHHRLLDRGLSQRRAVLWIYLATLLAAGLGLVPLVVPDLGAPAGLLGLLALLLLFRAVGAIRVRQTLARLRQHYVCARQARREQQTFEHLQLCFRGKRGHSPFSRGDGEDPGWPAPREKGECPLFPWATVCQAAEQLELAWVSLETTRADGCAETSLWRRPQTPPGFARVMTLRFPIPNVAGYRSIAVEFGVLVDGSLQSAHHRAGLFARLTEECVGAAGGPARRRDLGPAVPLPPAASAPAVRRPPGAP